MIMTTTIYSNETQPDSNNFHDSSDDDVCMDWMLFWILILLFAISLLFAILFAILFCRERHLRLKMARSIQLQSYKIEHSLMLMLNYPQ